MSNQLAQAGRTPEFDALASKFFTATGAARDAIYKEASALAAEAGPAAAHYLRVMEKTISGKEDHIAKESKRYVYSFLSLDFRFYRVSQPRIDPTKASIGICKT